MPEIKSTDLFEKAVIISVNFSRPGNRKKVPSGVIQADADLEMLHVSKDLLDAPEYEAVESLDRECASWLETRCVQPSPMGRGTRLLPFELVEETDTKLEEFRRRREKLIKKVGEKYQERVEESKAKLRGLWDPTQYPPQERYLAAFGMSWNYLTFGTPAALEVISKALFEREREKAEAKVAEATEEILRMQRAVMKELVDHLVDRVTPGPDGKAKTFHKTTLTKLQEFLALFGARNIANDGELERLVAQARDVLSDIDPATLRANKNLRQYVQVKMAGVKAELDKMVVLRPERRIVLDDDDQDDSNGKAAA